MELFTPEFGLVFWMFVVFVILFAILAKFAWPYIIRSLDERAELIDKGVEYAQEAKAQLDNAQADAKALLVEAQKQLSDDKTQVEMIDKLLNEIENQN